MTTIVLPSAEVAARQLLVGHPDGAALWGGQVATRLPAHPPLPFVRVERAGTDGGSAPWWIDRPVLDLHCYGADQASADLTARTAAAIIRAATNVTVAGAVVILGGTVDGPTRLFDTDLNLDRYLVSVTLTVRPLSAPS